MRNQYVNTLPTHILNGVKKDLKMALLELELDKEEYEEAFENALCSRLSDLSDTINIHKYLGGN